MTSDIAGQRHRPDWDVPPGGRLHPEGGGGQCGAGLLEESVGSISSPRDHREQRGHGLQQTGFQH